MFRLQIKYLSFFFILVSILSFFNIIYSYYLNLYLNLDTYYLSFFVSLIISILFYKLKLPDKKISIFDKILTVFLGYILIPLVLSIPFYFSIYNLTFLNSFFESISGFTSTGFTIFDNIKHIDQSLILWRSSTQWIGGLYFLFSIIFLIDIYDESFKKTLTNFISFDSSEVFKQAIKIFFLYSGLTLLIFIILNIFNVRSFDSLNLAFSLISSGGFIPANDLSLIIKENLQVIILSFLMLFSFFSIFFIYNLLFFKKKNINFFYEDLHLIIYYIFIVTIFFQNNNNLNHRNINKHLVENIHTALQRKDFKKGLVEHFGMLLQAPYVLHGAFVRLSERYPLRSSLSHDSAIDEKLTNACTVAEFTVGDLKQHHNLMFHAGAITTQIVNLGLHCCFIGANKGRFLNFPKLITNDEEKVFTNLIKEIFPTLTDNPETSSDMTTPKWNVGIHDTPHSSLKSANVSTSIL